MKFAILTFVLTGGVLLQPPCDASSLSVSSTQKGPVCDSELEEAMPMEKISKTDAEWRKQLLPEQYHVTREKGTEMAFTGKYHDHKEQGMYRCVACGAELFSSDTKFDSGTGWPSFWKPVSGSKVELREDTSHGMQRVEVICARCQSHLGHVFDDGPAPTNKRYCINSAALDFSQQKK